MTVTIVKSLEAIEIDPTPFSRAWRAVLLRKRLVEGPAIGNAREAVLYGQRLQAPAGFSKLVLDRLARGNIAKRSDNARGRTALKVLQRSQLCLDPDPPAVTVTDAIDNRLPIGSTKQQGLNTKARCAASSG